MRVCFVLPPFEIYAAERGLALAIITHEVTAELRRRRVATTVVTPSDGGPLYPGGRVVALDHDPTNVRASTVDRLRGRIAGWDAPGYARYLEGVHRVLDGEADRPDVLVLFNDLVTGGRLRHRHGVPVLTWLQNEVTTRHRAGLRELARTDGLLAVSGYIAGRCAEIYGRDSPPVHVVPNGVNPDRFTPPEDLDAPTGPVRACFVGRIDPNKGPLLAVEAVARARRAGADVTIDVAGPVMAWGQDDSAVAAYVDRLDAALAAMGRTRIGMVSRVDLPSHYRDHQLAFVPSVSPEPFGLVALEAMAAGCAVIASDRGGLPEVCGDAALLVDPSSPEQFDVALARLLSPGPELGDLRRRGRAHAERHSWSHTVDRLLAVVGGLT